MYITVQFKDKNKVFKGRQYDYILNDNEKKIPEKNTIIRMMDNNYDWISNRTRVKVVDIKKYLVSQEIKYVEDTIDWHF